MPVAAKHVADAGTGFTLRKDRLPSNLAELCYLQGFLSSETVAPLAGTATSRRWGVGRRPNPWITFPRSSPVRPHPVAGLAYAVCRAGVVDVVQLDGSSSGTHRNPYWRGNLTPDQAPSGTARARIGRLTCSLHLACATQRDWAAATEAATPQA